MDVKKIALLCGALVLAGVSAFMAKSIFGGAGTPQAVAATAPQPVVIDGPEILVATKALPVGTIIDPTSFRYQPWPKELMQNAYYIKGTADPSSLAGTVVRYQITAGQPLTQGALVKPGDRGFLAAALGPGMRAVTVSVTTQSGVAGFIFPGDRVDLMLSQEVAGGGEGPPLKVAETIVQNLRVLATDQRTSNQVDDKGNTQVVTFSNVTLEATPKIAEKIAVSQTMGALTMSLRSIADNTQQLESAIASGEVSVPDGKDPKAEKTMMLAIASRPNDSNTTFTVGGDVSRFQRKSVPAKPATASVQPGAGGPAARPEGPSVRVARGSNVEFVPVGGK
jgi:pilus assembly protein CpaB